MQGLREYMRDHGLTQSDLAAMLKVSQPTVSDWLSGNTRPTVDRLLEISKKTGRSVDELLKGSKH